MSWISVFIETTVTALSHSITAFFLYEFLLTFNNFNYTRIQFVEYQKNNYLLGVMKRRDFSIICQKKKKD